MEDLKTSLTDIWDSDASTDYQTQITSAIDSITTVLDTIIDDLTTAEDSQKEDPGIDAEPDTPEYDWKDESQWGFLWRYRFITDAMRCSGGIGHDVH